MRKISAFEIEDLQERIRNPDWVPENRKPDSEEHLVPVPRCISRRWEELHRVLRKVVIADDSHEGIRTLLSESLDLFQAHAASVMLHYGEPDEELVLTAQCGLHVDTRFTLHKGQGLCWKAFTKRCTVRVDDVRTERSYVPCHPMTRSELVTPLVLGQRRMGVLNMESGRPRGFSQADEALLEALASMIAISLARREAERDINLAREVVRILSTKGNLHDTLRDILKEISITMQSRLCSLLLREKGEDRLYLRASYLHRDPNRGQDRWLPPGSEILRAWARELNYSKGEGFTGSLWKLGHARVLANPKRGKEGWKGKGKAMWRRLTQGERVVSLAGTPLKVDGETIGALVLTNRASDARSPYFSTRDLHILETLADLITPAIVRERSLAQYDALLDSHEMGLCIVKKPVDWDTCWRKARNVAKRPVPMCLLYVNPNLQRVFGPIRERKDICYQYFNKAWGFRSPCPWCTVTEIFSGLERAEGQTHSPSGPLSMMRHYRTIARPYSDPLTFEKGAIESTTDITEDVEVQVAFGKLADPRVSDLSSILKIVAEALGRILQASDGWIWTRNNGHWRLNQRFTYEGRVVSHRDVDAIKEVCAGSGAGSWPALTRYIRSRTDLPLAYRFSDMEALSVDHQAIRREIGEVQFSDVSGIPAPLAKAMKLRKGMQLVLLPFPLEAPDALIVLGEDRKSPYFPREGDPSNTASPSKARSLCSRMEHVAALALERIRQADTMSKASELIKGISQAMSHSEELVYHLGQFLPKLLDAHGFSLFQLDPEDCKLHMVSTSGILRSDGARHVPSREEMRKLTYEVAPDCGLTGWVAFYRWPLNISRDQFEAKSLQQFFDREIRHDLLQELKRRKAQGAPYVGISVPRWIGRFNENKKGEHCYLGMPLVTPDGDLIGVCRITGRSPLARSKFDNQDVSLFRVCCQVLQIAMHVQRLSAERTQDAAWGEAAAKAAHIIGNRIFSIAGALIEAKRRGSKRVAACLQEAEDGIATIGGIIARLKAYRKSTIKTKTKQTCEPKEAVEKPVKRFRKRHDRIHIAFRSSVGALTVNADPQEIQVVLDELLENAAHYVDKKGAIRVSLAKGRAVGWCQITVWNSGSPIPEWRLKDIFKPYHTTRADGLGLGLAIVQETVERWGGSVSVQNPRKGGVRFVIRIPVSGAKGYHNENSNS